jgi:hypothetical protein
MGEPDGTSSGFFLPVFWQREVASLKSLCRTNFTAGHADRLREIKPPQITDYPCSGYIRYHAT